MIKFGSPEYKQKKNAALSLLGENRLQEANELYNSLCNKKNRSADDWYTLGAINGKLGDYTACIANSRKAVKYNPQHAPAWYCLGMAYQAKGEVDKALENICNAIGTNPDNKEYTDRFRRIRYELDQNRTLNVRIELGLEICVPASLECFTTYALLEQEDWFEHDIDFVRELLQPGDTVLDIGANYGVYTSTMASLVGDSGTVYAFEPASETAGLLRKTLANNTLDNVVVKQMALSSFTGTANLSNNFYSEMNSLSASPDSTGSEAVEVTTLDKVISETGIRDISFIKMDAEGEEANIIKGGENLFAGQSPLVMVEFRHNDELNLDLLEAFNRLGYSYYRFSPSPGILIPCDPEKDIASILLNIFCCKADTAASLAARNLLVTADDSKTSGGPVPDAGDWKYFTDGLDYADYFTTLWSAEHSPPLPAADRYMEGLASYAKSRDTRLPASTRYHFLLEANRLAGLAIDAHETHARMQTFTRINRDLGHQTAAASLCMRLNEKLGSLSRDDLAEPFVPATGRYENITPEGRPVEWAVSCVLEQWEYARKLQSFSDDIDSIARLDRIRKIGFGDPRLERRYQLKRLQFGLQRTPCFSSALTSGEGSCLNEGFWRQQHNLTR